MSLTIVLGFHQTNISQIFQFRDRKDAGYLLSPTHEEEITTLVSSTVKSYRDLPIRLYQICRQLTLHIPSLSIPNLRPSS